MSDNAPKVEWGTHSIYIAAWPDGTWQPLAPAGEEGDGHDPELLPCPFCGAPATFCEHGAGAEFGMDVRAMCLSLFCGIHTPWCDTREEAARMWNLRVTPKGASHE